MGSGLAVANQNLDIRGARSLLGTEQSGMAARVGFNLYMQGPSRSTSIGPTKSKVHSDYSRPRLFVALPFRPRPLYNFFARSVPFPILNQTRRRNPRKEDDGGGGNDGGRRHRCTIRMKLRHFLEYLRHNRDDSPLYIFDATFDEDKEAKQILARPPRAGRPPPPTSRRVLDLKSSRPQRAETLPFDERYRKTKAQHPGGPERQ